jgi:hypothetical protein
MNRTRIAASVVLGLALIPSAWHAWNARGMPFLGNFSDDGLYLVGAKSLAEGRNYRISSLPGEPYQTKYPPLYPALLALVALAGAAVWVRGVRAFHCAAFGAGLSILLAAWHYPPTDRLALPLLPPAAAGLYFAAIRSVGAAGQFMSALGTLGRVLRRLAPAAIVSLVLYTTARVQTRFIPFFLDAARRDFQARFAAYRFIERHTPENACFLAHGDTALYLYTGRHGFRAQLSPIIYYRNDVASFRRFLTSLDEYARERGLDYILLTAGDGYLMDGPGNEWVIARAALRNSETFRPAWGHGSVELYERVSP